MLSRLASYENAHKRQILSSDIDYYNRYVCTSSADGVILIVDNVEPEKYPSIELREHIGPVWQVLFSHPKYEFLASCGSDCKLILHTTNNWEVAYHYDGHKLSTTSIDWAPHKTGATIACSSADGTISIHTFSCNEWSVSKIPNAHLNGVNCISWSSDLVNNRMLLASGGNDNRIKIWQDQKCLWNVVYESDNQLATIKDLSWCPTLGLLRHMIGSCASDGRVVIWGSDDCCDWTQTEIDASEKTKQKISWSRFGSILSISLNNNVVKLWKQVDKQRWMCLDRKIAKKQPNFERLNKNFVNKDIFAAIV